MQPKDSTARYGATCWASNFPTQFSMGQQVGALYAQLSSNASSSVFFGYVPISFDTTKSATVVYYDPMNTRRHAAS